ncbi:GNAT family N-acetyltransferase [Alisedimentitalea sp. MJ-SS2]|uniref:GNAT family N-acetyltransferase n=1 Tax=Aliisedimentitalea sp. MJ-SS2 TaxID=3049795 RepID=UPI0029093B63|nr:GNAT family N-acetyltransferase [Alisedimentitalea sp. MJ-SS2]MDU8926015.1 GNAT family N-acetyltransferase [Alisedimentitalea sp. MJ-SS2]
MQLSFREATREDVPAVVAMLADDMLGQGRELEALDAYFAAFDAMVEEGNNTVIVGEDDAGEIVATYQLTLISGLSLAAARRAQVESVRVASHVRGKGAGQQMFADVETRARLAGCRLIQLAMNARRVDSRRFYEGLGFEGSHTGFKRYLD